VVDTVYAWREEKLGDAWWLPWRWWRCNLVAQDGCLGSGGGAAWWCMVAALEVVAHDIT